MNRPETRYAVADDGIHIGYQVIGDGPVDVLFLPNWFSNIELFWDSPLEAWFRRLASFSRLIVFDQRGSGVSDPVAIGDLLTLEERAKDICAVLDAADSDRAALFGATMAARLACFFAATHGDRTRALILLNGWARAIPQEDSDEIVKSWGTSTFGSAPEDLKDERHLVEWLALYRRMSMGPGAASALFRSSQELDVRHLLSAIHVATLVLHHAGNTAIPQELGRELADGIADARFETIPGDETSWPFRDPNPTLDEVQEFLTGARPSESLDRVLATILATDIVGSTERAARVGDRGWTELLARHHAVAQRTIDRFGGRLVDAVGDGVLATFDGPARAIRCTGELHRTLGELGLPIRAGLHAGEIELAGDAIRGLAVHIGARVSSLAGPGETLVSSTVKDLVVGSGIDFEDRGTHELKGVPGEWRIFAVAN